MSALAEALPQYQRRTIDALAKHWLNVSEQNEGVIGEDGIRLALQAIGAGDDVEQDQFVACLTWQRMLGVVATPKPAAPKQEADRSKATDAQLSLMRKLAGERNYTLPDDPQLLTRDQASKVIDDMKAGEYDQSAWAVPF